ncbi:MAG: 4Fe-4S dicluster domain-containing protein [Candidatus Lokiarchaeota archaeon]|nr:4Fe-4S dicluster domain-containing protein [Candidatus Lokiarchaeota archaeon]
MLKSKEEKSIIEDISKCYACGKCTSICPLSQISDFTPRIIAENFVLELDKEEIVDDVWSCLTCASCSTICPMEVNFPQFIREVRKDFKKRGLGFEEAHFGIFSNISRLQTSNYVGKPRSEIYKGLKIQKKGDILYWTGCTPFFDLVFDETYTDISRNTVRILNYLGIKPVILDNEKCCGHDLLWNGDIDNFKKLAKHNIKEIERAGVKTVVTTCAEGYRTLKLDYPDLVGSINFEVISFSEFLESRLKVKEVNFQYEFPYTVTYQDPCRLGRHMKVYEAPRNLIKSIPGINFIEMPRNRESALCCGVSCWHCNLLTKSIRMDRLKEADETADILITTCPKCKMHFQCLLNEKTDDLTKKYDVEVIDLSTFLARALFLI